VLLIIHTGRGVGQWLQNRSARPRTRSVPDRVDVVVERIAQLLGGRPGAEAWDRLLVADVLLREAANVVLHLSLLTFGVLALPSSDAIGLFLIGWGALVVTSEIDNAMASPDSWLRRTSQHVGTARRWLARLFTRHGPSGGGGTTAGKSAVLEEPGVEKYAIGRAVGRAGRAVLRKLQLRWAGPARAPPGDLEQVQAAIAERRARLGAIDERRWSTEQRTVRDAAFAELDRVVDEFVAASKGDRERLLADASAALATLYRFTDKRLEFWRNGLSRSHRRLFLPVIAIAGGVANWGVYTMAVLSAGVAGIGPGMLFSVGFAGFVAGLLLWAPWSGWFSRRAMTIGSLLGMAAGFGWFALAGGTTGYVVAAFVLGFFTSGYVQLEAGVQRWVATAVGERRRGGEKLRLSDGITGLVYLGITFVLPAVLQMQELLLPAGLVTVAGVSAVVAVVAAVGASIVMPTMSPTRSVIDEDRRGWRRWAAVWWQLTRSTFTVLKDPFVLSTALVFGLVAATIGAFDGLWRAMMPGSAHVLEAFYNFALMAGGVVLALSLIAADLQAARQEGPNKRQGLLERRPDAFMFTMAVVMAAGAAANLVATLAGAPLLGIGLLAYLGEGSSTAMIVAVYAMLDRRVADGRLAAHLLPAAETATNFVKAIFQYGGAQLAALLVAAHPLPGGWPAVSVQNTTTAILTVGAAAWLWWYTARWPWLSRAVRAVSAAVRSLVRKLGPGDRDGLPMHWAVTVAGSIVTLGTVAAAAGLPTLWIDVTAVAAMAVWALVQAVRAVRWAWSRASSGGGPAWWSSRRRTRVWEVRQRAWTEVAPAELPPGPRFGPPTAAAAPGFLDEPGPSVRTTLARIRAVRLHGTITRKMLVAQHTTPWKTPPPTGEPGRGGPLAVGDLPARVVRWVLRELPRLASRMGLAPSWEYRSLPRGPPGAPEIRTLDSDAPTVGALRRAGVRDPAGTLIAFGWVHPEHAPRGVIVLFRHVLDEVNRLIESGRLEPEWFADLIAYETRFRIHEHARSADGRPREAVAADLLDRLERARRAGAAPTLHDLRRYAGTGRLRTALVRYLISRDPAASVRRHERIGSPLVRRLVMSTVGRFSRSGEGTSYRLDLGRAPLEAVTAFALRGSVVNEAVYTAGLLYSARNLVEDVIAGRYGPGFVANAVAALAHAALIALQRYNRARMVRAADRMLALGHGYRADFRNWAGLDRQALQRHHTATPARARPRPWVTATIVAVNAAVAAVVWWAWAERADARLFDWIVQHLPFVAARVEAGQWWRVLSSAFLHDGVAHLLSNMVVLLLAGPALERLLGRARTLTVYGAALLGGALAGLVLLPPTTSVVGASGAVFGVLGAVLAAQARRHGRARRPVGVAGGPRPAGRSLARAERRDRGARRWARRRRGSGGPDRQAAAPRAVTVGARPRRARPDRRRQRVEPRGPTARPAGGRAGRGALLGEADHRRPDPGQHRTGGRTARRRRGAGRWRGRRSRAGRAGRAQYAVASRPGPVHPGRPPGRVPDQGGGRREPAGQGPARAARRGARDVDGAGARWRAVAERPLTDRERERVVAALRATGDRLTPLEELPHRMPRGPPGVRVLVWDGEFPVPGVVAFGWGERGVVVIARRTLDEIAGAPRRPVR
jgi:membrane associated rhomboid family serine protease